mgnify:CR=1 FL=1
MGFATGKHALITGGGTGIGAAAARMLAAEGAKLSLLGRRKEPLEPGAKKPTAEVKSLLEAAKLLGV